MENFLIDREVILLFFHVFIPLMKPSDKNRQVLTTFQQTLSGKLQEVHNLRRINLHLTLPQMFKSNFISFSLHFIRNYYKLSLMSFQHFFLF